MKPDNKQFAVRSEEIQELINRPPSWIQRYGLLLILFLVSLAITVSLTVKVPDYVSAPCTVRFVDGAGVQLASEPGQVDKVVPLGETVKAGQVMAEIGGKTLVAQESGFLLWREPLYVGKQIRAGDTLWQIVRPESRFIVHLQIDNAYHPQLENGQTVVLEEGELRIQTQLTGVGQLTTGRAIEGLTELEGQWVIHDRQSAAQLLNLSRAKVLVGYRSIMGGMF